MFTILQAARLQTVEQLAAFKAPSAYAFAEDIVDIARIHDSSFMVEPGDLELAMRFFDLAARALPGLAKR